MSGPPLLLQVSPHADDEILGAPSLTLAARDAGWRVVNLLCFVSAPDHDRRLAEVRGAATALDIELRVASDRLLRARPRVDPGTACSLVQAEVSTLIEELSPRIISSPSPHDVHLAHEAAAGGVRAALEAADSDAWWAMWGLWGELPIPTTVAGYEPNRMAEAQAALSLHRSQIERIDLPGALEARSRWNAAMGPELVMGHGYRPPPGGGLQWADMLTETRLTGGRWMAATPRVITDKELLDEPTWGTRDLTSWLHAPSAVSLFRPPEPEAEASAIGDR